MELNKDNMKRAMVLILYTVVILALAFHMEYAVSYTHLDVYKRQY